ncbi:glycosyltransferase family 39 protein [Hyphomicrobium sp. LHD-15]|uniref:glycosyltransferase family 39 protein n=1 Tax=Hyphomicrobium sp. LHD-15 TaxID=3072142 RepID=UPI00280E6782|nr:glycosyltransferase family 39 protein [Hyphomicrobium sp. LHD-15]MDQ8700868.1 glycosyltransferase family 39 protein [Hyphomicrobium sp. LHD-15]
MIRHTSDTATIHTATALLAVGTLVRLALAALLDPGVDEAYAMAVATQWQLSWFDHPPMAFWWVKAMHDLAAPFFGDPVPALVLRLPFVLAFTATSAVMFDLTRRLWGARAGLWTLVALTLAPFFMVSAGSWMVPDGPLALFLALTARLLAEILFFAPVPEAERERRLWLAAGLTLGLAALSKYHAALFALGAVTFVLITPHRRRLAAPGPWLAVLIASIVASPVLIWNAENGWVSLLFQSSRGVGPNGINWSGLARAILGQMGYLGPWTVVATVAAAVSLLRTDRTLSGPSAFLVALALPSIVVFTAVPLWGGHALPHWQMPGWLFLLPILGRAIADIEKRRDEALRLARGSAVAATAVLALAIVAATLVRVFPPSPSTVTFLGIGSFLQESVTWRGLAAGLVDRGLLAAPLPADPKQPRPLVVAFRWIEAARIAEALGAHATVAVFGSDPRGFAFLADPAAWIGRDVLLIGQPKTFARRLETVRPHFSSIDIQSPIGVKVGDIDLFEVEVAIGRNLISPYPLPYPRR